MIKFNLKHFLEAVWVALESSSKGELIDLAEDFIIFYTGLADNAKPLCKRYLTQISPIYTENPAVQAFIDDLLKDFEK